MSGRVTPEWRLRVALVAVGLASLGVSLYLTVERARGHAPSCIIGGGCATVQASRYSELGGIPVAWLGVAAYVAIIAGAVWSGPWGALAGLFVTTVSVGLSGWLTYVELIRIDEVCAWCVMSALLTVSACTLAIARLRMVEQGIEGHAQ